MPRVSVIIPTHNRAHYAVPSIRSALAASPEIEVVVSDTSEVDLISPAFAGDPNLSRLRLVRQQGPLSVVDNFNAALRAATGDYLVFIGDDDFVGSSIAQVAEWAGRNQVDALKFSFPVLYHWPDYKHRTRADEYSGTLHIAPFSGAIISHDARKALAAALHDFGGGVLEMPRAYAGMVSRKLVERICQRYGQLFGGVSPDIYSAALISLEAERCVKIDYPVIIPGASGASTAGQSANGKHVGGLRDNAHIGAFRNLVWDERIPEFYSVPTVWSYSLLKAVEHAKLDIQKVNFPRLYTKCLLYQRPFTQYTKAALGAYARSNGWAATAFGIFRALAHEIVWVANKLHSRFKERFIPDSVSIKHDLPDTVTARQALESHLANVVRPLQLDTKVVA